MSARRMIGAVILLAAGALSVSHAGGAAPENGWGQFKFGMTPDQARAVPGVSWKNDIKIPSTPVMFSAPITSEYGSDTHVFLGFNGDQKLRQIKLSFTDTQSAPDCEKAFQTLLTRLDAKYGAFAPGGAKDEWIIQDMVIRGDLLERTSAAGLPGSRSHYWRRVVLPNISGLNLEAEAKHSAGSRWIELMMYQKDGKDGCQRSIAFSADMPDKAQRENQFKLSHIPTGMDWHWAETDRPGRGFSSSPAQTVFSTGAADHVRLSGGKFSADIKRPAGGPATVHLMGTISDNKISAHVPASEVSGDFPASFEGIVQTFATDGEPVDVYEILLTGTSRWGSTRIAMAAYHRNAPHVPTPEACRRIAESVSVTRERNVREMTYKGFLQALGCPPP